MSSDEDHQDGSQDEDNDENPHKDGKETISLTNFLFGNVDEKGQLESEFLDDDTKRQLSSLERLGVARNLLTDIVSTDEIEKSADKTSNNASADSKSQDDDYDAKSPSAIDYSDITELADEVPEDEAKFRAALHALPFKMPTAPIKLPTRAVKRPAEDDDDDYDAPAKDQAAEKKSETQSGKPEQPKLTLVIPPAKSDDESTPTSDEAQKKLDTPLAAMLPTKYKGTDVTEIFPEFRREKVLRFSRLFGPGKPSHLPQPWKHVLNKRKVPRIDPSSQETPKQSTDTKDRDSAQETDQSDQDKDKDESMDEDERPEFTLDFADTPSPSQMETDDEDVLERTTDIRKYDEDDDGKKDDSSPKIADWRYGPAQYWYDFIGVPESGDNFDYGLKLKIQEEFPEDNLQNEVDPDPDDAYHLVTQLQWEDDIIWNGDDIKAKVLARLNDKNHAAGWVPSGLNRTASAFTQQVSKSAAPKPPPAPTPGPSGSKSSKADKHKAEHQEPERDETWYSIFPVENEELVYGFWEEDIIWDAEAMKKIPEPRILTLDPNDENIVLGIPDDIDPKTIQRKEPVPIPLKEKKVHHLKKSRILLGKAGVIAEPEPEAPPQPQATTKDPFNISNDEFYNPKMTTDTALKPNVGGNLIQHSIPALELRQPFFPTHLGQLKLRAHHRPALRKFSHGTIANSLPHPVYPLLKHMKKKMKQREQERIASGGGEMFFMRTPDDLSGKDGELILAEMSEEHSPLVMQVGMATKIKNYYKRKPGKDGGAPNYTYGEIAYAHTSPFLGNLAPGQSIQTFENNLFRAPIYEHKLPDSDFLIIRTRNSYFIREIETIFTVGQELPLFEVPGPNSKKANNFIRDFLQVFIYRLFWKSNDYPRRIKMEDIKKAFPLHSESSIRKRLKLCADFKRTGMDSNWWVLKTDFRLPTEDEMRALVSPEQCCAYYSMIAAEQRLKDAGYGEKSLFAAEDENDDDLQLKMDDEIKAAPWNTTRAFIAAMKGKCLLQLHGVADPTGCGEGFSYVRVPNKPQISKEEQQKEPPPKKTVTGTDADLRRLPLNQAKNILRKNGVPEDEIKKLSRWEVIDVVRTLSTEQAKAQGAEGMSKFARGNRFSIAEHQERYKEDCQRVFELQNRILSSIEELSTDEDESEEDDSDIDEMGKNIENMLSNKKTSQQLSHEKEEAERRELQKLILGEDSNQGDEKRKKKIGDDDDESMSMSSSIGRILKIYRTFKNDDGKEYVSIEIVRKPAIIDTYVRIRQTKDNEYIRKFATALDEQQKEEKRREKRRIQEQLRRLKRNEDREKFHSGRKGHRDQSRDDSHSFFDFNPDSPSKDAPGYSSPHSRPESEMVELTPTGRKKKEPKIKKPKKEKDIKMKCGACGGVGHMKTNRACPLFRNRDGVSLPSVQVAMTVEEEEEEERMALDQDSLVKVDETKVVLSKKLWNHAEDMRRKTLVLKVPKELMKRKRRVGTSDHCDYLQRPEYKAANRRRTDPLVTLSTIFDNVLNEIKDMEGTTLFWQPVNAKQVPDYYKIVTQPMDIQTMRKKCRDKQYPSRGELLIDLGQMVTNSILYNGPNSVLTGTARRMLEVAEERFKEKEDKLTRLEKAINPLLDDNDQVALSYIFDKIVEKLKAIPESWPFHVPVDKKKIKNYYDTIEKPMDIETLKKFVKLNKYSTREEFLADVELIFKNSYQFNGPESQYTKKAEDIVQEAKNAVAEQEEQIGMLEQAIATTKEAALEAADNESVVTGGDDGLSRCPSAVPSDEYMDYDDTNSQGGLLRSRDNDTPVERDLEMTPEPESGEDSDTGGHSRLQPAEDEIVDENYDPEEFLLERFNQPPPAPAPVEREDSPEPDFPSAGSAYAQPPTSAANPYSYPPQTPAREDGEDDGLWF